MRPVVLGSFPIWGRGEGGSHFCVGKGLGVRLVTGLVIIRQRAVGCERGEGWRVAPLHLTDLSQKIPSEGNTREGALPTAER